ncbi:MAG: hypothetical protein ACXAD7_23855 [Candidatus Kariarchaeaceae archaeon]|jgi:hypothetical protein
MLENWTNYRSWFKIYAFLGILVMVLLIFITLILRDDSGFQLLASYLIGLIVVYPFRVDKKKIVDLEERTEIFRGLIQRSSKINITQLSKLLVMDETKLLQWLLKLPSEFGFTIDNNIVEFSREDIDTHIDQLLDEFSKMEKTQIGKI